MHSQKHVTIQVRRRCSEGPSGVPANDKGICGRWKFVEARCCRSAAAAAEEAVEKISRLEVFTSYDFKGKAILTTADLEETMSSFRDDGFRAVKLCLRSDPGAPARTHRAVATFLSRWPCKLEAANEEPWSALVVEVMLQLQAYAVAHLAKRQCIHLSCGEPIDSSSTKRHCTRCQDQEAELTEYEIQQHE